MVKQLPLYRTSNIYNPKTLSSLKSILIDCRLTKEDLNLKLSDLLTASNNVAVRDKWVEIPKHLGPATPSMISALQKTLTEVLEGVRKKVTTRYL